LIQNILEEQQLPGLEEDSDFQEKLIIKAKAYKAFRYIEKLFIIKPLYVILLFYFINYDFFFFF